MIKKFINCFIAVLIVIFIIIFITLKIFNLNIKIAKGNSMKPNIYPNDILITRKFDKYNVGDIIEFEYNGLTITHRINAKGIDNGQSVYYTLGDNNKGYEIVYHNQIKGKIIYRISKLNMIYNLLNCSAILVIVTIVCIVAKKH